MTTPNEQERIQDAFEQKSWTEIKASSSWQIFKIMAEFVEGFEKLSRIGPCVSIFGSARTLPTNPYYGIAQEIAERLVRPLRLRFPLYGQSVMKSCDECR